jgi:hypothetical protein
MAKTKTAAKRTKKEVVPPPPVNPWRGFTHTFSDGRRVTVWRSQDDGSYRFRFIRMDGEAEVKTWLSLSPDAALYMHTILSLLELSANYGGALERAPGLTPEGE